MVMKKGGVVLGMGAQGRLVGVYGFEPMRSACMMLSSVVSASFSAHVHHMSYKKYTFFLLDFFALGCTFILKSHGPSQDST